MSRRPTVRPKRYSNDENTCEYGDGENQEPGAAATQPRKRRTCSLNEGVLRSSLGTQDEGEAGGTGDGPGAGAHAGAGAGPGSQHQGSQHPQPHQSRPARWEKADVQDLERKIARYKQEEAKRKEEAQLPLQAEEVAEMAGAVVRHMLFSHFDKPGVPLPRAKLNEALLLSYKDHASRRKIPGVVIAVAQARLLACLGMEMVEVERPSDKKSDTGGAAFFVLRSALPYAVRTAYAPPSLDRAADPGLAILVLAIIQLAGGKVEEGALWEWLAELGVQRISLHPHFGKPNEALHKVEAARYVIRRKVTPPNGGAPTHTYEWGECAHEEVQQAGVKAFITALFQGRQ